MKILSFVLLLVSFNSFASNPCGGSPVGYWTNPDGSRGGWVAKTASVQAGAIIAPGAEVCDSAQVKSGAQVLGQAHIGGRAQILKGAVIEGRAKVQGEAKIGGSGAVTKVGGDATVEGSSTITGSSNVFARAKVGGGASVHNSIICQASVIEGISVENSDYYCQTEDPEPPHPGEAGKKTLLGVDSDRDGVRDDVEIWINDRFSNTPEKDNYNYRMSFKQYAQAKLKRLKFKSSKEKVLESNAEGFDVVDCISSFQKKAIGEEEIDKKLQTLIDLTNEFSAEFFNTKDRIKEDVKARAYAHGSFLKGSSRKSKCYFKVKK